METTLAAVLKDYMGMEEFPCLGDQLSFSISSRNFVVLGKTLNNSPQKVQQRINSIQPSVAFHTETSDSQCKSSHWFLYEMQHWAEMG